MKPVIGIDIGGTKIAAAVVSRSGEIHDTIQEPTSQTGPTDGVNQVIRIIQTLCNRSDLDSNHFAGIGIGIPAALEKDTDRILWAPNIKGWTNVDLRGALEEQFHIPAAIEYDGHTAVLGEWWQGSGKGCQSVLDVIIGTGIGSGAVIDGRLIKGNNRLAGALGWQVLSLSPDDGEPLNQKIGFWENLAAGPGIAKYARETLSDEDYQAISNSEGIVTAKEIFDAARSGNKAARQVTNQTAKWIGLGISNAVSILNPEIVVLGGNVGHACDFLLAQITETVRAWSQPISGREVKIVLSQLGTKAGILGAAYGVIIRLEESPSFTDKKRRL